MFSTIDPPMQLHLVLLQIRQGLPEVVKGEFVRSGMRLVRILAINECSFTPV